MKSEAQWIDYVKNDGSLLEFVPESEQTHKIVMTAVSDCGQAIRFAKDQPVDICDKALLKNIVSLVSIRDKTDSICRFAVMLDDKAVNLVNEERSIVMLRKCPDAIRHIRCPTPSQIMTSVTTCGKSIKFIDSPSRKAQIAAVTRNADAIQYIQDPSKKAQIAAVIRNGLAIQYIQDPSVKARMAAVTQNGLAIRYIQDPSPEERMRAVTQNGISIRYFRHSATAEEQKAAITQNSKSIFYCRPVKDFNIGHRHVAHLHDPRGFLVTIIISELSEDDCGILLKKIRDKYDLPLERVQCKNDKLPENTVSLLLLVNSIDNKGLIKRIIYDLF